MGKISRRHKHWHQKSKLGCMWSWITMFDFGHSRGNQKLLSANGAFKSKVKMLKDVEDNGRHPEDWIVSAEQIANANKVSVKRLIEEEMVTENTKKRNKISVSGSESGRRNQKKENSTSRTSSKIGIPFDPSTSEKGSGSDLYIEAIMQEIFSHIQQKSVSWSQQGEPLQSERRLLLLEERISEATKTIMRQKFINGEHLTEARKAHYYNKYMDTLEMLNTNKEYFLKLSEDPNSALMKQFKNMPNNNFIQKRPIDSRLSEEKGNDLQYTFLRRNINSQNSDKSNDKSDKIVILKPERTESRASPAASSPIIRYNSQSHFSLSEIRKKLRLAMRKDRHGTSTGDVASMSPYKNQKLRISDNMYDKDNLGLCSPSRNHFFVEKVPRPSSIGMLTKVKSKSDASAKQRVSSIYIEAKRHLSELLNNGDDGEGLSSRKNPKTLEKLLLVPDFVVSPSPSPGRGDFTAEKLYAHAQVQPCNRKSLERVSVYDIDVDDPCPQSCGNDLGASDGNTDNGPNVCNPTLNMDKEHTVKDKELETHTYSLEDESTSQGETDSAETTASPPQLADTPPNIIYEPTSLIVTSADQNNCLAQIYEPQSCSICNGQESSPSPLIHPFFSAIDIDADDLASSVDKSERPSPISVLEHVFSEDEVSPAGTKSCLGSVEPRRLRPICIQFDEDELSTTAHDAYIQGCLDNKEKVIKYVEAVLSSTDLCWEELYLTSLGSSQLLDATLLHEIESQVCYGDRRLLFDCVNEVLNRMCERYYGGCPLLSYLKFNIRPVPKPHNAIQKVREGVEWHILPPPHPQSLEQIVSKDLERDAVWMELRLDVEGVSVEMETTILEELMEDAVLSCMGVLLLVA
uniref:DUF4378 domain-containing protein n=1 Tax=Kalanchoe fedtschenkoi TaxID=63787 RepID=A0A7N0VB14_KALFE